MHHKYVVRHGDSVWTGSTNETQDSWTLEENVILVARSQPLAAAYGGNFEELWRERDVEKTGRSEPRPLRLEGYEAQAWFTPGRGPGLSHRIAQGGRPSPDARTDRFTGDHRGAGARHPGRGRSGKPGGPGRRRRPPADGAVFEQWQANSRSAWKLLLLSALLERADFKGDPPRRAGQTRRTPSCTPR